MSTTTWNSDLLSKGSIFSCTSPSTGSSTDRPISASDAQAQQTRGCGAPRRSSSSGVEDALEQRRQLRRQAVRLARARPRPAGTAFIHRRASQGVTTKAIASDSSMPMLALIGIGLMYGPISPETKAIGSSAAMTVSVARMVGPPTSSTAPGMICASVLPG